MLKYLGVNGKQESKSQSSLFTFVFVQRWCENVKNLPQRWLQSCKYKSYLDVRPSQRMNYIISGYREENQPVSYYLKSVFYPNNQAMNAWTHFIPLLFFIYRYYVFIKDTENSLDPIYYPFYVHGIGICFLLMVSTGAHTFCSHSHASQRSCFSADFAAIYLYGLSFMIPLEYYLCPMRYHCKGPSTMTYYALMVTFVVSATSAIIYTENMSHRKAPLIRTVLCAVGLGIVFLPCIIRYYIYTVEHKLSDHPSFMVGQDNALLFSFQFCCLSLATFFYSSRYPECSYPGRFDIVGHSHNFFHLSTALCMYLQSRLLVHVLSDIDQGIDQGDFFDHHFDISWQGTFGIIFLSAFLLFAVVGLYCYRQYKEHKIKKE